jgi:hypothetical protein
MKTIRCNYCEWVGIEPSPAEFKTQEEFDTAITKFEQDRQFHECDDFSKPDVTVEDCK